MSTKRIVIDLDIGADDALALLLFLYAEKLGNIKIEAIFALMATPMWNLILNAAGRIDIPIYKGFHHQLLPSNHEPHRFYGFDGFGDLNYEDTVDLSIVQNEPAAVALHKLVCENPNEISLICLGPLTNLAVPMRMFDDFTGKIKEIFIMGGNYTGVGNITSAAEFNFFHDPEAAHIVFDCANCPITLIPIECGRKTNILFNWRFNILGKINRPVWNIINRVEKHVFKSRTGNSKWMSYDSLVAAVFLYPNIVVNKREEHISVELHGSQTRGQVVVDHMKKRNKNVVIIEEIDDDIFKEILLEACQNV